MFFGWRSELREFLDFVAEDATKDMDIVRWWQVHHLTYIHSFINEEVGSSKAIPHACKNRIGHSCCPGILRTLRAAIFLCKTDSEWSSCKIGARNVWTNSNSEICVERQGTGLCKIQCPWGWGGRYSGVEGNTSCRDWDIFLGQRPSFHHTSLTCAVFLSKCTTTSMLHCTVITCYD